MTQYYVDFNNQLPTTWTMAVYQTLPDSVGLDSVSWKQTTVPMDGLSGVSWTIDYDVCLANYEQVGGIGVYAASQTVPAKLGTAWQVVWQDSVQQLVQTTNTNVPSDSIYISNVSDRLANLGIGMSGSASIFKRDVADGAGAQFDVTPTYYAGLFNQVVIGEVIKSNVVVGPFKLQFPNGMNKATLTATLSGSTINVEIEYSQQDSFSLDEVERTLRLQELHRFALPAPAPAFQELEAIGSNNGA